MSSIFLYKNRIKIEYIQTISQSKFLPLSFPKLPSFSLHFILYYTPIEMLFIISTLDSTPTTNNSAHRPLHTHTPFPYNPHLLYRHPPPKLPPYSYPQHQPTPHSAAFSYPLSLDSLSQHYPNHTPRPHYETDESSAS